MDMTTLVLLITQAITLIAVVALGFVVFALARQIGVLHERITPVGALMTHHGPNVGDYAQAFDARTLNGSALRIGGSKANGKRSLVLFTSPTCPVCKKLMPSALSLAREEQRTLDLILVSDGALSDHEAFREVAGLQNIDYVVSTEIGMKYQIGRLPFGLLLDEQGRVLAKGLTNTREHLESLLNVESLGVSSIQQYRARKQS
jgi:methylamine dehydrogenase accessory protein MauD